MAPFTRSKVKEAMTIPYDGSVTKLHVYDLLEEGTQCPNCHTEILPNRSVYLHRGCSNVVCASCFETNLLQEVGSDLCLICKSKLAEPCAEDALPNWRFTYTTIPFPEFPTNSSNGTPVFPGDPMVWTPLLSPPNKVPFPGFEIPATDFGPAFAFNPLPSPFDVSAELAKLSDGIIRQSRAIDNLTGTTIVRRDNTTLPLQTFPYPTFTNPLSSNVSGAGHRNANQPVYSGFNKFENQGSLGIPLSNDPSAAPRFESNPPNQRNVNAQYEKWTTIEPQPTSQPREPRESREPRNPRKRDIDDPQREAKPNAGGQRHPRDWPQRKPKPLQLDRDIKKFPGDGRSPRLKHQRHGPQAQRQQSQSRAPRGPRGNQSQSEGQSDSSQAQTTRPRPTAYRETRPRKRRSYKPYVEGSQAETSVPRDYRSHMRHATSHTRDDTDAVE